MTDTSEKNSATTYKKLPIDAYIIEWLGKLGLKVSAKLKETPAEIGHGFSFVGVPELFPMIDKYDVITKNDLFGTIPSTVARHLAKQDLSINDVHYWPVYVAIDNGCRVFHLNTDQGEFAGFAYMLKTDIQRINRHGVGYTALIINLSNKLANDLWVITSNEHNEVYELVYENLNPKKGSKKLTEFLLLAKGKSLKELNVNIRNNVLFHPATFGVKEIMDSNFALQRPIDPDLQETH